MEQTVEQIESREQFLERLRKTPRDWYLTQNYNSIRRQPKAGAPLECPISALLNMPAHDFARAGQLLGLPQMEAMRIARAADNSSAPSAQRLRAELLEACGLTNQEVTVDDDLYQTA